MASLENSLKYEAEVESGKIRLITSGEFVRAYNHSEWLFYCCISKYKVIRKYSKAQQKDVYFLGFPVSKLLELINGRFCEKTEFGYDIVLKPEEVPAEEVYEAWTKEVPVEAASRADASATPLSGKELEDFYGNAGCVTLPAVAGRPTRMVGSPFHRRMLRTAVERHPYQLGETGGPRVRKFLRDELELELNKDKVRVVDAYKGVEFLGAFIKPYRTYPVTRTLRRMRGRLKSLDWSERPKRIQARVNSMLGVLSHYDCWQVRKVLAWEWRLRKFGEVTDDCLRFYPDMLKFMAGSRRRDGRCGFGTHFSGKRRSRRFFQLTSQCWKRQESRFPEGGMTRTARGAVPTGVTI